MRGVSATRRWVVFGAFSAAALLVIGPRPASAHELKLEGNLTQGGLVFGRVAPGSTVLLDGRRLTVLPDGRFLMGFARSAEPAAVLKITGPDGKSDLRSLAIAQRDFEIQHIDGLPQQMVTPDEAALQRIAAERELIVAARARQTPEPLFDSGFTWPAMGPISGVFGSQRILNGEPRQPHYGVDVAAPQGTPIVAPADGIVSLAEPDLYFTGGTVILDHGLGLTSIFAHMATVTVKVGERVPQGAPIGTVGATGRVTGPHLHWGMNLSATALDPQLIVGPMPEG